MQRGQDMEGSLRFAELSSPLLIPSFSVPFPRSLAADIFKPSWLHGLQLVAFFIDGIFFLSRNTCALLSVQLCHFLLTQTKWEANTSLKILPVIWYDTVWEMLKPFQGSKRADCGGVKESFPARAAGCTAPVTACQGWCVQPRSALLLLGVPAGICFSGHGTRRAHHAIACPAWLPDNPYPIQAISSQLACSILYIWSTDMGLTVTSSSVALPVLGSGHQCQSGSPADLGAHLHQLRVWSTWEYSGLGFRTQEWGHGGLDLQGLCFQWT